MAAEDKRAQAASVEATAATTEAAGVKAAAVIEVKEGAAERRAVEACRAEVARSHLGAQAELAVEAWAEAEQVAEEMEAEATAEETEEGEAAAMVEERAATAG